MHKLLPLAEFYINLVLGYGLGVILHELGHYVFAIITGLPVSKVVIGAGKLLRTSKVRSVTWEVRAWLVAGRVLLEPSLYLPKYRYLLMISGGVIANAAFAAVLHTIWKIPFIPVPSDVPQQGLLWAQIYLVCRNLLPTVTKTRDGPIPTDGYQLLHYWKQPSRALSPLGELYVSVLGRYTGTTNAQDAFSSASVRLAGLELLQLDTEERVATLKNELLKDDHSQAEEVKILDGLMTKALSTGIYDPVELSEWTERALVLGPDIQTVQFTVGAVLIELGQYEEGIDCIESAIRSDDKPFDNVIRTTFLARAEHALGNHEKAEALAQSALKLAYLTDRIGGGDHDGFLRGTEVFLRKMDTALSTCDNGHPLMSGQAHAPSQ